MAQLQQKRKSAKKTSLPTTTIQSISKSLGKAPNDIYELENQIKSIHSNSDKNLNINDEKEEYKTFAISNISTAKQELENGASIQLKLTQNMTPHALIAIAHSLGFDTIALKKLFNSSSIIVKNILDKYVNDLRLKHTINNNHPYASTQFGYLYHSSEISALQCDNDLSAKCRIKMDLDFNKLVSDDNLFQTKFKYELSTKVFKCSSDNINIIDVRAGSIIVVIAGITLITLASVGLLALSIKLRRNRKLKQKQQKQQQEQLIASNPNPNPNEPSLGCDNKIIKIPNQIDLRLKHHSMDNKSVNSVNSVNSIQSVNNKASNAVAVAPPPPPKPKNQTFVSSLFSKMKSGFGDIQKNTQNVAKQFTEQIQSNTVTPNGNSNNCSTSSVDDMYSKLIVMGFDDNLSKKAAKKYSNNINNAINWIMEHQNDQIAPDVSNDDDNNDGDDNDNCVDIIDDDNCNSNNSSSSNYYPAPSLNNNENLILSINDPLWVKKKNQLWSATVIALSRDKVTVEYENSPYLWRKTETFALNDKCLSQKEPGMDAYIEGCISISKSNGGYIKAWKTGLDRPMADI